MSQEDGNKKAVKDEELDDLLNSALADFDKFKKDEVTSSIPNSEPSTDQGNSETVDPETNEFLKRQKMVEKEMLEMFGVDSSSQNINKEDLFKGMQQLISGAVQVAQNETEDVNDPQLKQTINDTISELNTRLESFQQSFNPDEISQRFSGIDLSQEGGGASADNQFLPFMQGMMQSLLSAEVLLPSLKDLSGKYPQWLAENGDKIEPNEKERFIKQQQLMESVCAELETEKPTDSSDVKMKRFHNVLEKMQKMQDLGNPPEDLVGELGPTNMPPFDPSALNDPSQCCLM